MKMTPTQITAAYRAALELSKAVFPYKTARKVAKLVRALAEEVDTLSAAERALVGQYGGSVSPGGNVDFPDRESALEYSKARADYMSQEADIKLPAVDISKYTGLLQVSPNTIYALDGIVIFEAEEGDDDG